ncbi:DEAD/DEAH box helicase [Synechococcales cyanobacterium C]|uniref:DEAD/DEAH box helicase n=1 Tax=Petrachloros mirabilis ULC683 TaxID=2781853 RepID=A0A8K1ZY23_9CYAN|nr:DEAD/DEAH box helicase [Petrachloros mirabilis]NCJ06211.1 DEAD/DEAH box helicase [Petrachloros mirabilis ULC683]
MTTLPPSNSNFNSQVSTGFNRLHSGVQRWIWQQKWPSLRPIQEEAIPWILEGETDLIISAATAGGKTEAAFLPIFSRLMEDPGVGIRTLCISPLKALINDQYRRLSGIGEDLDIAVTPWHGDVDAGRKQRLLKQPTGILIITPESLEALFIRHGSDLATIFQNLNYLIVDELHAFIGSERGKQLQSLMHRVEQVVRRKVPRIGLSATLGDMGLAAEFLRTGKAPHVRIIESGEDDGREIRIQVRGYRQVPPILEKELDLEHESEGSDHAQDKMDIAAHLFKVLRGETNLIFINSRSEVEAYADQLRRFCEIQRVPNEFWPHHGSLSKDIREEAEKALKNNKPANVVCTTTLEMGIDIGSVKSIAQVGAPFSVSSTRQRLGRSGRTEGDPAIIRFYISEPEVTPQTAPQDTLHPALIQTIAIINLMVFQRWCEPPLINKMHLSTLIQQILSLIAQYGGINAAQLWQVLCETGPFGQVGQSLFIELLRQIAKQDLIQQTHDGLLILGLKGERLVNHYSFYTAFQTPEEYRIVTSGKALGTLPIDFPLVEGMLIILAGRRWQVLSVDIERKVADVKRSSAGRVPRFSGNGGSIHDQIRQEMYGIYNSEEIPIFLDQMAQNLLQEARENFLRFNLNRTQILSYGNQTLLFPWMGSVVSNTIQLLLHSRGLKVAGDGVAIALQDLSPSEVINHLQSLMASEPPDSLHLAALVQNKSIEKYDHFLNEDLLCWNYASCSIDIPNAWNTLCKLKA